MALHYYHFIVNYLLKIIGLAMLTNSFSTLYAEPIKVACVGDSITEGSGTSGQTYPLQLQALLGEKWKVSNFGLSARTLMSSGDFPYQKETIYQRALASKPDVVIIMLGTNDTKPHNWAHKKDFLTDYKTLVKSFQDQQPKPKIHLCFPCLVVREGNFGITEQVVQEQIPMIEAVAKDMGCFIINMHAALEGSPELIPDRVHPDGKGAAKLAEAAFVALTGQKPSP